jgi:tetratricopeptide (TPR) repeat protein
MGSAPVSGVFFRRLAETNFSPEGKIASISKHEQFVDMRAFIGIVAITFAASVAFGADVRDLGVPPGWRAADYDKRGHELLNKHDYENARRYLTAAIRTEPDRWSAYYNRAITFYQQKNWAAALQDLNATIHLKPSFFRASLTRARVNQHLHNYSAALRDFDVIAHLALKVFNYGEYCDTLNSRAWIRATCPDASIRNGQLAIADAKKACELDKWKYASEIDTLAAAYAEAGDFDSAIRYQERAITLHKTDPEEASKTAAKLHFNKVLAKNVVNDVIEEVKKSSPRYAERLELYKQHRPYREAAPSD